MGAHGALRQDTALLEKIEYAALAEVRVDKLLLFFPCSHNLDERDNVTGLNGDVKFKVKLEEIEEMFKCFKQNRRCALDFDGRLGKFIKKESLVRVSGRESTKRDDETQKLQYTRTLYT